MLIGWMLWLSWCAAWLDLVPPPPPPPPSADVVDLAQWRIDHPHRWSA